MVLIAGIALNAGLAAMIGRDVIARRRALARGESAAQLYLRRRTVPHLRAHRPFGVVETQVRWRQAAETHRRRREAI